MIVEIVCATVAVTGLSVAAITKYALAFVAQSDEREYERLNPPPPTPEPSSPSIPSMPINPLAILERQRAELVRNLSGALFENERTQVRQRIQEIDQELIGIARNRLVELDNRR